MIKGQTAHSGGGRHDAEEGLKASRGDLGVRSAEVGRVGKKLGEFDKHLMRSHVEVKRTKELLPI